MIAAIPSDRRRIAGRFSLLLVRFLLLFTVVMAASLYIGSGTLPERVAVVSWRGPVRSAPGRHRRRTASGGTGAGHRVMRPSAATCASQRQGARTDLDISASLPECFGKVREETRQNQSLAQKVANATFRRSQGPLSRTTTQAEQLWQICHNRPRRGPTVSAAAREKRKTLRQTCRRVCRAGP